MFRPLILICCLFAAPVLAETPAASGTTALMIVSDHYGAGASVRCDGAAV
ncbi:hypothetical protein LHP98_18905 [Rhodobacter sp. Har01]|nr:hypothetical protein [Rhodobacter sp. Har01]MCB6180188.1 hypothetical protein [Rhodobacter sp. Har01]